MAKILLNILLQKLLFFILYTLLSDVGNMVSPEIGAYPKLALIGAFGHKSDFFLVNQIFVYGHFLPYA